VAATIFFVWAGALSGWPGWLGLGITLASWGGLLALSGISGRTEGVVERSLVEGLGSGYRDKMAPGLPEKLVATPPDDMHHRLRQLVPFLLTDPEVRCVRDIEYAPGRGPRGMLDVYLPRNGKQADGRGAPVLMQIHGGAWMVSQKRHQALPLMLHLARCGWVCVAPNYRLSPRATFPEHLLDLKQALRWIREHVAEYGGDPDFVVATGGSAGGHLSSLLALTANDAEYQPGFEDVDTSVRACVPFYGVYDFTDHYNKQLHDGLRMFLETTVMKRQLELHREEFEKASPIHRVHAGAPPFFVIHGTHDSLAPVEEARQFVEVLRKTSRAPVAYAELPGAQHAFEVFHSKRTAHVVRGVDRFLASVYSRYLEVGAGTGGETLSEAR
jgi:acetyl esterase/lipase